MGSRTNRNVNLIYKLNSKPSQLTCLMSCYPKYGDGWTLKLQIQAALQLLKVQHLLFLWLLAGCIWAWEEGSIGKLQCNCFSQSNGIRDSKKIHVCITWKELYQSLRRYLFWEYMNFYSFLYLFSNFLQWACITFYSKKRTPYISLPKKKNQCETDLLSPLTCPTSLLPRHFLDILWYTTCFRIPADFSLQNTNPTLSLSSLIFQWYPIS